MGSAERKKMKRKIGEKRKKNETDYLGKDRLSYLISSRSSVEYQINRTEWDKTDKWQTMKICPDVSIQISIVCHICQIVINWKRKKTGFFIKDGLSIFTILNLCVSSCENCLMTKDQR